jgi:hypothetical protein
MAAKKKADAAVENTAEVTQETTEQVQDTVEQMTEGNKKELDNKSLWLTTYFQPSVREWKI